jgi:hypothetical protein
MSGDIPFNTNDYNTYIDQEYSGLDEYGTELDPDVDEVEYENMNDENPL